MKQPIDTDDLGNKLRKHITATAKQNAPPAVQVSVYDGSRQLIDGYVWGTVGDKRVQVIAPGPTNLTAATIAAPIVVWALPPNPDEASGAYLMVGSSIDGATNNRAPGLITTGVTVVGSGGGGGVGTVTSVALTATPTGIFDVAGSPVTTSGTLALSMDNQSANQVLAGPTTGAAATPAFRSLVATDIPDISATYVPKSLYDANTLLTADSDNTPVALTMGASTILARLASGSIVAATVAQIKTLLALAVTDVTSAANTALSNLASVAINTSLISDTDNTDSLGSASVKWKEVFSNLFVLEEGSAPATPAANDINIYADSAHNTRQIDETGQDSFNHRGDYAGYSTYNNDASEKAVYTRTIKANSLGSNGIFGAFAHGRFWNNALGSARNANIRVRIGGVAGTPLFDSGAISVVNNSNMEWWVTVDMGEGGATNDQHFDIVFWYTTTYGANATPTWIVRHTPTTFDTTTDMEFDVTVQWAGVANAALNHFFYGGRSFGPYYA